MLRIPMERSGEMEVFLRVVREGGFSAAARSLDLTPSAVSKLIARLEARLGARLLVRTTRALTLTEEGLAYQRAALRIVQELDDADQAASAGAVRGRLRTQVNGQETATDTKAYLAEFQYAGGRMHLKAFKEISQ